MKGLLLFSILITVFDAKKNAACCMCVNKKDRWQGCQGVVHNLIKAIELAPRRTAQGLMIGLLLLICLMLTLKEIKKNIKRFLAFHHGSGLSEFLTEKEYSLRLECNVQP